MATPRESSPLPLQERVPVQNTLQRLLDLLILFLLLALLFYRLATTPAHGSVWLVAFLCESWFAFVWILYVNGKWNPVVYKTHPERLSKRFDDLPAVDLFVTTADPKLEPPIVTVNTVLSLLAVDYPAHRLACYVSDDGGSPLTFYALSEASKFARLWVPFCKRYSVRVRAPFVYFSGELQEPVSASSSDFNRDWLHMKNEYEELSRRIQGAAKNYIPYHMKDELADFSNITRGNHPSIVKVLWEDKESEEEGIPHLVYVSREKRPKNPHHFKAGAMNVLTRVSGVMTNAPFMLNVDCDMFANNPEVILHGMCLLLGFDREAMSGFVQAPQQFYGALKDDPFGNQLVVLQAKVGLGIGGIQGPMYAGTGCFHRRKIIYGSSPDPDEINGSGQNDELSYEELQRRYGNSRELIQSVCETITAKTEGYPVSSDLCSRISAATQIAACTYEFNTCWGKEFGWIYGSMTEDVLTGLHIHAKGWRSVYLTTDPPPFLGNAPTGGPASLTQYKRWSTGLLEILFSKNSPLVATLTRKLRFRQCLGYLFLLVWALRSIFEYCYALLPAYSLLTNTSFLPKVSEPAFLLPITLFVIHNISSLFEYLDCGLSIRAWWNNQRMQRIVSLTAWLSGFLSVLLKLLGISDTIFEVTRKDQECDVDPARFTFDTSPVFVPGVAAVLIHLVALVAGVRHAVASQGFGELGCSLWLLASFWPFVKGLWGKGSYGIPWAVIWKAAVLGSIFILLWTRV